MDGIVGSLKLGWDALLLKEKAYEEMRTAANPVVKGLILIIVVGVVIALCMFVGDVLEWASTPDLDEIRDTVFYHVSRLPFWEEALRDEPEALDMFEQNWDFGWSMADWFSPNAANAAVNVILLPLGLIVRWLIYGLLAYLFARWMGGTGDLSETLGVLALAVAPQALHILGVFPYIEVGGLVSIWAILCAYVGLRTAHKLPWSRAAWATLLPFILVLVIMLLAACLGTSIFAAVVKGG